MAIREQDFNLISYLTILEVAFDQAIIDVNVCGTLWQEGFEENVGRNKELLLLVDKLEGAVAIAQIMQSDSLGKHVVSDTPHLNSIRREELSTIDEAASFESNWVISLVHDEHSDDSFVTIDDEISSEFMHVFLLLNELLLRKAAQVAVFRRDHDGDLTNADVDLFRVFIVNSSAKCRV